MKPCVLDVCSSIQYAALLVLDVVKALRFFGTIGSCEHSDTEMRKNPFFTIEKCLFRVIVCQCSTYKASLDNRIIGSSS